MRTFEVQISFKEPKYIGNEDEKKCPFEEKIYLLKQQKKPGAYYYLKDNILYTKKIFSVGNKKVLSSIDDYYIVSDKYIVLYFPMLKNNMPISLKNRNKRFLGKT